jgi:hypothetical protein
MPTKTKQKTAKEVDSVYFLKLVVYLVLGSFWLRLVTDSGAQIPLPVGLLGGILLLRHERLQLDKKIGYAILLMAAFISFWLPLGLHIVV